MLRLRFAPARNDEYVRHCERPKGAWQSHKKTMTRLLRRFAPRNDTLARLLRLRLAPARNDTKVHSYAIFEQAQS